MTNVIHTIEVADNGIAILVGEFNGRYSVTIHDVDANEYMPVRVQIASKDAAFAFAAEFAKKM